VLNLSELAKEIGMSVPTIRRWISILETGYQVFLLYPYYQNIGKRVVKAPKLYFNDTALATYLLGINDRATLLNSPSFGRVFETMIVTDVLKRFLHFGQMPSMYYLRSRDGLEVDLILEINMKLHLFEIKSAMTIYPRHGSSLVRMINGLGPAVKEAALISMSEDSYKLKGKINNYNWKDALGI
jgi:hypothetical protein